MRAAFLDLVKSFLGSVSSYSQIHFGWKWIRELSLQTNHERIKPRVRMAGLRP